MADLDGEQRAFFRAALAACILVHEEQLAEPWPLRRWYLKDDDCPPASIMLAAWSVADAWRISKRSEVVILAGERVEYFLRGNRLDSFIASLGYRLKEVAETNWLIERHADLHNNRLWHYVRPASEAQDFLATLADPLDVLHEFARQVALQYRLICEDEQTKVRAMRAWNNMRNAAAPK